MTIDEAKQCVGRLVRIAPQAMRGREKSQHWGRGKVVAVGRRRVSVRPFGHKVDEEIEPEHLHLWQAQEPETRSMTMTNPTNPTRETKAVAAAVQKLQIPMTPVATEASVMPAAVAAAAPLAVKPAVVASPQPTVQLSAVLAKLTSIMRGVQYDEEKLGGAEERLAAAQREVIAAEAAVLESMSAMEVSKAELRNLRGQLDQIVGANA